MNFRDKDKMVSIKLFKQLKALERKEKLVAFSLMLDEVSKRINMPIKRRMRRSNV
jgi:hypothetical protein